MKKLLVSLFIGIFVFHLSSTSVLARRSFSFGRSRSYSSPRLPRYNSNPRYIIPRNQIPVPKSERVNPYFKRNGTYVPGYLRAPYGSLRPWYNPFHR